MTDSPNIDEPLFVRNCSTPRVSKRTSPRLEGRKHSSESRGPSRLPGRRMYSQGYSTHRIEIPKYIGERLVDNDGRKQVKEKSVETRITESNEIGPVVDADAGRRDVEMTEIAARLVEMSDVGTTDVRFAHGVRNGNSTDTERSNEDNEGPSDMVESLSSGTDKPSLNVRQGRKRVRMESDSGRATFIPMASNITYPYHVTTNQTDGVNRDRQKPRISSDHSGLVGSNVAVSPEVTAALKRKLKNVANTQPSINSPSKL
jgi:hypothetical protein